MSISRPIVLIEDDQDDILIFKLAMERLGLTAPVREFTAPDAAFDYLSTTTELPSLILCDFHVSAHSGIDFRSRLNDVPRLKALSVPFILITTAVSERDIQKAFELPVQGIFFKEGNFEDYVAQLKLIVGYWSLSVTPNNPRLSKD